MYLYSLPASSTHTLPSHIPDMHMATLFPFKDDVGIYCNLTSHPLKEGEGRSYILSFSTWLNTSVMSQSRSVLFNREASNRWLFNLFLKIGNSHLKPLTKIK